MKNHNDIITDYINKMRGYLNGLHKQQDKILEICEIINKANKIFICGNGGSSATASHLANDFQKMCGLKAFCLSDNIPLITAWANDSSYASIFLRQLEILVEKEDIVILLSGSGKSLNINLIADWCLEKKIPVIAFVGMDGGYIKKKKGIHLIHINSGMQHSEDWQLIIGHILAILL